MTACICFRLWPHASAWGLRISSHGFFFLFEYLCQRFHGSTPCVHAAIFEKRYDAAFFAPGVGSFFFFLIMYVFKPSLPTPSLPYRWPCPVCALQLSSSLLFCIAHFGLDGLHLHKCQSTHFRLGPVIPTTTLPSVCLCATLRFLVLLLTDVFSA